MKVLVIGGTGILSTAVVNKCISRGDYVTMLNRGSRPEKIPSQAKLIKCNVRNMGQLETVSTQLSTESFDVTIDFLVYTLDELKTSLRFFSKNTKQYVFISSAQVYDTSVSGVLVEESRKPQKLWSYSVNKFECENFLIDYCSKHNISYTIIRPAVNYDGTRIPYGIFPPMGYHWTMVERIKNSKPIITWNNGQNKLNLTRVEDFAEATVSLLGNSNAYNEDFNVAGDNVYTWMDVLDVIGELIGKKPITIDIPVEYYAKELPLEKREELLGGRACDMVCSIDKLRKVVPNFCAKYKLKEGVKMTMQNYENNNYLCGIDYLYDGDSDRIIKKYCKEVGKSDTFHCQYTDYLSKGKLKDRYNYFKSFNKDNPFCQIIIYTERIIKKIYRAFRSRIHTR